MQIHIRANKVRLCCSGTNAFINFWLRFFNTRRETQFLQCWPYYADPTNVLHIPWCLRSLSVEIRKTKLHLQLSTVWQKLNYLPAWSNVNPQLHGRTSTSQHHGRTSTSQHHGRTATSQHHGPTPTSQHHGRTPTSQHHGRTSIDSFSKSSNSRDHLFRVWRHPHSSPIFCLGVYYDNGDCHILCARA